jgi:hypothetical protein
MKYLYFSTILENKISEPQKKDIFTVFNKIVREILLGPLPLLLSQISSTFILQPSWALTRHNLVCDILLPCKLEGLSKTVVAASRST